MKQFDKNRANMPAWLIIVIILLIISLFGGFSDEDKYGASIDWGKDYYWSTTTHQVEKKPWVS